MPRITKSDEFSEKFRRGGEGGGHFQSKNLYCKIWTFKQVYVTMKLIQSVARLKNLQYNFPKMRGRGGSKAVWNFSENSSILEGEGVPNLDRVLTHMVATHVLALTLVPNFGERYDGQVRLKLQ